MDNTVNRIVRIVFGSILIGITMTVSTAPLGGFALLPLIAIPVILSGLYGENPIGEISAKPVSALKVAVNNHVTKIIKRHSVTA